MTTKITPVGIAEDHVSFAAACPITGRISTKMIKQSFERQCKVYKKQSEEEYTPKGWSARRGVTKANCTKCLTCKIGKLVAKGKLIDPPKEVMWITIEDYHVSKKEEQQAQHKATERAVCVKVAPEVLVRTKQPINADIVREIRVMYNTGEYSQQQLATIFFTSRRNVGHIVNKDTWKDVQ